MTPSAPPPSFPLALEDDADDVAWALRTAGVEWNRGARADALEWLLRAVDTAIDAGRIERAREIQRNINDLSSSLRSSPAPGPSSSPPSRRPKTSSMPPLPPPPGFEEALAAEAIDVEMDVDVELDEEAEEVESLEVLEAEVIEEEAPEEATTQWSIPADDQITEDDIEPIDGGLEVIDESIRVEADAPVFASEPPTVQNQLAAPGNIPLPLDFDDDDQPLDPTTLPPGPVRPQPLPRFSEVEPATTAAERLPNPPAAFANPDVRSMLPDSGPRPEPFHRSPSFGDNLMPPASVVLRAANAILDADPTIPPAPPAPSPAPPSTAAPLSSPVPPPLPQPGTPPPVGDTTPQSVREPSLPSPPMAAAQPVASDPPPSLLGIQLAEVRGLEDLPEESQQDLSRKVRIYTLEVEEEVTGFGLALVLSGKVSVMPAIMDVVCVRAGRGELIFAESHVEEGVTLKVVAAEPGTRVAAWPIEQFAEAIAPCPWVRDELRGVGDRLQAFAGAAMGLMGEQLDELLRGMVFERCSVKLLLPGEAVATAGKPLAGMTVVGAGRLEVSDKDGNPSGDLGPGDIVYPSEMLRAAPAPANVKASEGGALIVFADRKTAHELMMSVPPLIEVLSS